MLTDLDTGGAEVNNLETVETGVADDEVPVGASADTAVYTAIPDCSDEAYTLGYNASTNAFVCNADSGAGGGMTSWTLAGDSGTGQTITDGNTATIAGDGVGIDTADSATDTLTISYVALDAEAENEGVLDLQDLQGAVTDSQVPDDITISGASITLQDGNGSAPTTDGQIKYDRTTERLQVGDGASTSEFIKAGTLTDTKYCIYDATGKDIDCDSTPSGGGGGPAVLSWAVTSAVSPIATGDELGIFTTTARTLDDVMCCVIEAPTGSGTTIDIQEAGTTVLSTAITIDDGENCGGSSGTQGTAATAAVISDSSLAAAAYITAEVTGEAATTQGVGLQCYVTVE